MRRSAIVLSGKVMRMSQRVVAPGFEQRVDDVMGQIRDAVKGQPGLISIETMQSDNDPNRYTVFTRWESKEHEQQWLSTPLCTEVKDKLDEVLDGRPVVYRLFKEADDDVFLL